MSYVPVESTMVENLDMKAKPLIVEGYLWNYFLCINYLHIEYIYKYTVYVNMYFYKTDIVKKKKTSNIIKQ